MSVSSNSNVHDLLRMINCPFYDFAPSEIIVREIDVTKIVSLALATFDEIKFFLSGIKWEVKFDEYCIADESIPAHRQIMALEWLIHMMEIKGAKRSESFIAFMNRTPRRA